MNTFRRRRDAHIDYYENGPRRAEKRPRGRLLRGDLGQLRPGRQRLAFFGIPVSRPAAIAADTSPRAVRVEKREKRAGRPEIVRYDRLEHLSR